MKVIDLLNKIANNEEVPKKIKWKGKIYEYDGETQNYIRLINCTYDWLLGEDIIAMLNDEIEIIEEKPKKIKDFEMMYPISNEFDSEIGGLVSIYNSNLAHLKQSVDELTKAVNYLLEKESDK